MLETEIFDSSLTLQQQNCLTYRQTAFDLITSPELKTERLLDE